MEIKDINIADFLINQINQNDVTNFGYLLIPHDSRLNEEALFHIREKFRNYCSDNDLDI